MQVYDMMGGGSYDELRREALTKVKLIKAIKQKIKDNKYNQTQLKNSINELKSKFYLEFRSLTIEECMALIRELKQQIEVKLSNNDLTDVEENLKKLSEYRSTLKKMNEILDKKNDLERILTIFKIDEIKLSNDIKKLREELFKVSTKLSLTMLSEEKLEDSIEQALEQ